MSDLCPTEPGPARELALVLADSRPVARELPETLLHVPAGGELPRFRPPPLGGSLAELTVTGIAWAAAFCRAADRGGPELRRQLLHAAIMLDATIAELLDPAPARELPELLTFDPAMCESNMVHLAEFLAKKKAETIALAERAKEKPDCRELSRAVRRFCRELEVCGPTAVWLFELPKGAERPAGSTVVN